MSLLGVEVGKRHCAAAVYSAEGGLLAQAAATYRPAVTRGPLGEITMRPIWDTLADTVRRVVARAPKDLVVALAIAGPGDVVATLDANGRPMGAYVLDCSSRSDVPCDVVEQLGISRVFERTGRLPGDADAMALLRALRVQRSGDLSGVWRCVPLGAALAVSLGGAVVSDYSQASCSFPLDTARQTWSSDLLRAYQMPRRLLPELMAAGSPIGMTSARASEDLGLFKSARIVLGGETRACQALAVGALGGGMAALDLGATLSLCPPFNAIPLRSVMLSQGLPILSHVVPGVFVSRWQAPGERVLRWFRDRLAALERQEAKRGGKGVYDILFSEMPDGPTDLVALYMSRDGEGVSQTSALLGVDQETTRGAIVKALLEGMSYQLSDGLSRCERVGIGVQVLRATGGGTRSERWLQLVADILGLPVESYPTREAAPLGAALLAGVGAGVYADAPDAASVVVQGVARVEPDAERHLEYVARARRASRLQSQLAGALAVDGGKGITQAAC